VLGVKNVKDFGPLQRTVRTGNKRNQPHCKLIPPKRVFGGETTNGFRWIFLV